MSALKKKTICFLDKNHTRRFYVKINEIINRLVSGQVEPTAES